MMMMMMTMTMTMTMTTTTTPMMVVAGVLVRIGFGWVPVGGCRCSTEDASTDLYYHIK